MNGTMITSVEDSVRYGQHRFDIDRVRSQFRAMNGFGENRVVSIFAAYYLQV